MKINWPLLRESAIESLVITSVYILYEVMIRKRSFFVEKGNDHEES